MGLLLRRRRWFALQNGHDAIYNDNFGREWEIIIVHGILLGHSIRSFVLIEISETLTTLHSEYGQRGQHFYWMRGMNRGEVVFRFSGVATNKRITLGVESDLVNWIRLIKIYKDCCVDMVESTNIYNYSFLYSSLLMLYVMSFVFVIFVELTSILWSVAFSEFDCVTHVCPTSRYLSENKKAAPTTITGEWRRIGISNMILLLLHSYGYCRWLDLHSSSQDYFSFRWYLFML